MPVKKGVIIFIHGVGIHQPNWATEGDNAIGNVLRNERHRYPGVFPDDAAYDERIEVVGIHYDSIFETVRQQWETLRDELNPNQLGNASETSIRFVEETIDELQDAIGQVSTGNEFAATHALDAVMYKGSAVVQNVVRHSVASQLAKIVADRLTGNRDNDPNFVVAGHSLGTAVAHDALHLLARGRWISYVRKMNNSSLQGQEGVPLVDTGSEQVMRDLDIVLRGNSFGPSSPWQWSGAMMISNVGNLFCRPKPSSSDSYVSPMRGNPNRSRIMLRYVNVDHTFDPVAKLMPFSAASAFPRSHPLFAEDRVELHHFYDRHIHALSHYVRHPSVSSRLFAMALQDSPEIPNYWGFAGEADASVGTDAFPLIDVAGLAGVDIDELQEVLSEIAKVNVQPNSKVYKSRFIEYFESLWEN